MARDQVLQLRASAEQRQLIDQAGGGSAFIPHVTLYSAALGVAYCFAEA